MGVRKPSFNQAFSLVKSSTVIIMVLTKNFIPQKLGRNQKEPLCHTIKRLLWVLSLNILLWTCLATQITFFALLYRADAKTFAYIVLAMPLIYVCFCALLSYRNCFAQNQQTKIRFFMISGLFLVFEISTLMFYYTIYFIFKIQFWTIPFDFAVFTSINLYMATVFAKMAFTLPSLQLTDMYSLEKISSLDKTCGEPNVPVFSALFMTIASVIRRIVGHYFT